MKNSAPLSPNDGQRNHDLDNIRGVAVILILILHAGALTPGIEQASYLYHLVSRAAVGMQLFFVLSGYMISESWDRVQRRPQPIQAFAIRRAAKILPLYFIMLHLNIVVFLWESTQPGFVPLRNSISDANLTLPNYIAHLFMLQGVIPDWQHSLLDGSWSIVAEVYFYALAPLLLSRFLTNPASTLRWICAAVPFGILFAWLARGFPGAWSYYGFPNQFPCFLLGVLVHRLRREKPSLTIGPAAAPLFALCVLLTIGMYRGTTSPVGLHIIYAILFSVILFVMLARERISSARPRLGIISEAGRMSYAMFFSHLFLLKIAHPFITSAFSPAQWPQAIAVNAAIAAFGSWFMSRFLLHPIDSACVAIARRYLSQRAAAQRR